MGYQYDVQIQNGGSYVVSTKERLTPTQIWKRAEEIFMGQYRRVSQITERVITDEGIQTTEVRRPYETDERLPEESE